MYIDVGTLIAVILALISAVVVSVLSVRSAYLWEERYHQVVRLLKTERAARR